MKILKLSRSRLDIAHSPLTKPLMTIGRSPTCDILLRAPGIQAIHFIIEWLGSGTFQPNEGRWAITDISKSADESEGVVLGDHPVEIHGLVFALEESHRESAAEIGGVILENLSQSVAQEPQLLEVVQVRTDSGAIEEVNHFSLRRGVFGKKRSISRDLKEFRLEIPKMSGETIVRILHSELQGAEFTLSGRRILSSGALSLKENELLKVHWQRREFYLRLVENIKAPAVPTQIWESALLRNLFLLGCAVSFIFLIWVSHSSSEFDRDPLPPPPRVAIVQIPPEVPPVQPETPKVKEQPKQKVDHKKGEVEEKAMISALQSQVGKKKATPPKSPEVEPPTVQSLGLLGVISKSQKKAETLSIRDVQAKKSISAADEAPVEVLESRKAYSQLSQSAQAESSQVSLSHATSHLSGAREEGGIQMKRGSRSEVDSSILSTEGISRRMGPLDSLEVQSDFLVSEGGLDRTTVKSYINSFRLPIRTCYERALITNPRLSGRLSFKWTIGVDGQVTQASVYKNTVSSDSLAQCVLGVIQTMKFPASLKKKSTNVIYPFIFQERS
ncbi:MAG: AgmX/PglI C-terminal domain-containing protein [Bdellovibrionia bacterium]